MDKELFYRREIYPEQLLLIIFSLSCVHSLTFSIYIFEAVKICVYACKCAWMSVCTCVSLCVCMCLCVCVCVFMSVARGQVWLLFFRSCPLFFLKQGLLLTILNLTILAGWLTSDLPVPSSPVLGLQKHHCTSFFEDASETLKCSLYSYMECFLVIGLYP